MENDHKAIVVIIPIFNRPEYGMLCLESLYSTPHGAEIAPVVVDCGSRPKTVRLIQEWVDRYQTLAEDVKKLIREPRIVHLCHSTANSFSRGINAGVRSVDKVEEEFVCFLHSDTVVFPGWLEGMVAAFEDEDVGVVLPRTNYANEMSPCDVDVRKQFEPIKPSNKDRIATEDINDLLKTLYGEDRLEFAKKIAEKSQLSHAFSPDISSFCMLTKGEYFLKYGRFDEDFFQRGFEDKFWFRAMQRDGLVCMISNRSFVHHFGNITSDGPGFCWPDIAKVNEEKYKLKCLEADRLAGAGAPNSVLHETEAREGEEKK